MMEHALLIELVGILIALRLVSDAVAFEFEQFRLQRTRDNAGDLVLQFEQVGEVAIESLGHYVMAGVSTDQLRRDPHPVAGFAYAALDDVARANEMMSSVMPSAKYSCSGSSLKFRNGRTAIARRSSRRRDLAGNAVSTWPSTADCIATSVPIR